ncbi:hypothetical protein vseg_010608 [Gypsophila vaccaria]
MRGMKGKLMKKLKSAKQISYLKNPNQILQVSNLDAFVDNLNLKSTFVHNFPFKTNYKSSKPPAKVDVEELKDEHIVSEDNAAAAVAAAAADDDKENVSVLVCEEEDSFRGNEVLSETDDLSFRRPDMETDTLFDPRLLAAFRKAVSRHIRACGKAGKVKTCEQKPKYPFFEPEDDRSDDPNPDDQPDPLLEFNEKCPPGGTDSVIFYTTSLRGIRKTFEECQSIRFLLQSLGVVYYERDVSIHTEFRDELWRVMGEKALPPRLFIRGRYIGGADRVLTLNEQGKLRPLFRDIPIDFSDGPCRVCCGLRFMLCYICNGSRKVFQDADHGGVWNKCSHCNENGLVVCPLC